MKILDQKMIYQCDEGRKIYELFSPVRGGEGAKAEKQGDKKCEIS